MQRGASAHNFSVGSSLRSQSPRAPFSPAPAKSGLGERRLPRPRPRLASETPQTATPTPARASRPRHVLLSGHARDGPGDAGGRDALPPRAGPGGVCAGRARAGPWWEGRGLRARGGARPGARGRGPAGPRRERVRESTEVRVGVRARARRLPCAEIGANSHPPAAAAPPSPAARPRCTCRPPGSPAAPGSAEEAAPRVPATSAEAAAAPGRALASRCAESARPRSGLRSRRPAPSASPAPQARRSAPPHAAP